MSTLYAPDTARHEIKFVAARPFLGHLQAWLKSSSAGFSIAYPQRRINNIYFDTPDYQLLSDSLGGSSIRSKIRYRWYGETAVETVAGTLEVKYKRDNTGWKLLFPSESAVVVSGAKLSGIKRQISSTLAPDGRQFLQVAPMPVIANSYLRQYYISSSGHIRATIDTRLSFFEQRLSSSINLTNPVPLADVVVFEAKCLSKHRAELSGILADIPLRQGRFSKYSTGIINTQAI